MTKEKLTVTLDEDVIKDVGDRAKLEVRSTSSMVNYLLGSALEDSKDISTAEEDRNDDYIDLLRRLESKFVDMVYIDPPHLSGESFSGTWDEEESFFNSQAEINDYVAWMKERIIQSHRTMSNTGSIFFHCDHQTAHYFRVELDEIFGLNGFRQEFILLPANDNKDDVEHLFWYSKETGYVFNEEYSQDKWTTVVPFGSISEQESFFERIILLGTDENGIILDPVCNNSTFSEVANRLKRSFLWINANRINPKVEGNVYDPSISPEDIKNMKPQDFEEWVCKKLSGDVTEIPCAPGVDGLVHTSPSNPKYHGSPIQAMQSGIVGKTILTDLTTTLNSMDRKFVFLVAFSFTKEVEEQVEKHNQSGESKIHLLTVDEVIGKNFDEIVADL